MKEKYIQILTTVEKKKDAEKIAKIIAEKRLAGCIQIIGPITSTYWWEGKLEKSKEYLLAIKTRKELYKEVEKEIKKVHPYKVPEIIAIPIIEGSEEYLKWLSKETKKSL